MTVKGDMMTETKWVDGHGHLRDVAIFQKALTPEQAQALASGVSPLYFAKEQPAWWQFWRRRARRDWLNSPQLVSYWPLIGADCGARRWEFSN